MKKYPLKVNFEAVDVTEANAVNKAIAKLLKHASNADVIKIGNAVEKEPELIKLAAESL